MTSPGFCGNRLREAYLTAGLTQGELARRIGTDVRNVSRWVNGQATPRVGALLEIARVTGRPLEWFEDEQSDAEPADVSDDMLGALLARAIDARIESTVARILAEHEAAAKRKVRA